MTTMTMEEKKINGQFGEKVNDLFRLMLDTPDWRKYVSKKTSEIIQTLYDTQSMTKTMEIFDMKYTTVRAHIMRAVDRIGEKRTDFRREGKSEQAQELFSLMNKVENWKEYVTDYEADLAEKFREVRNFYELGRELDIAPGNIAGTLYGTTQKIGVIAKIKAGIPQTERRDVDNRRENESNEANDNLDVM